MSVEATTSKNNFPLSDKFIVGASLAMCGLATLIVVGILAKAHVIKGINSGWSTAMITVGNVVAWGGLLSFLIWGLIRRVLAIEYGNKISWDLLNRKNLPSYGMAEGLCLTQLKANEYLYYREPGLLGVCYCILDRTFNRPPGPERGEIIFQNVSYLNFDLSTFREVSEEELRRRAREGHFASNAHYGR